MNRLVQADSFLEILVPFIVMIFWGIAQLASRNRKPPGTRPDPTGNRTPSPRPVSPEDDIRRFFEELNRKAGQAPDPRAPEPVPARPPVRAEEPRVRVVQRPAVQRAPVQAASDRMKEKQREIARAMHTDTNVPERDSLREPVVGVKRSRRTMLNIRMPRVSLPRMNVSAHDTALPRDRTHNLHRPSLRDRAQLRRAILAKEILGKPKALDF